MFAGPEGVPVTRELLHGSSSLPVWIVLLPLLAGALLYLIGEKRESLRKAVALGASFLALVGVAWLMPAALAGTVEYRLADFMQLGLFFKVDLVGWIFAGLIALVWFLAVLFSLAYMDHEHNRRRYYSFLIFTLGATLGVVFAGDFFTLFLFFELMTFSSFVLVIHEQNRQAMEAGALYLYLGVAGGLALFFAILLLYSATGTVSIVPLLGQLGGQRTLIYILFLIGFGIKAGVVPLHIWLPQAHPVAPSPASALLSGIMIKAGAYGILRVTLILFTPAEHGAASLWSYQSLLGYILLWLGIVTMFSGALMALLQQNAKRILAYSSVSQIGYIVMGLGAAAYMGLEGGMGFAGSVYHIINHAFFKAGLFMIVGTVYMLTHELELPRLGGLARKMPFAAAAFLVAACGIAGIPGFNGYASKTLLHDALLEAYKHFGFFSLYLAERIFVVTSALTVCYFIKLFRGLFLGPVPEKLDRSYRLPLSVRAVLGAFSLLILGIGLFPNLVLEKVILPAAHLLGFEGYGMKHLAHFHFFELHPLEAMGVVLVLALVIYLPGALRGWFNWAPPRWLSIHALLYQPLTRLFMLAVCRGGSFLDLAVGKIYDNSSSAARLWCRYIGDIDTSLDRLYERSGQVARGLADRSNRVDQALDEAYAKTGRAARRLVDRTTDLDHALDEAYAKTGQAARRLVDRAGDFDHALDQSYETAGRIARGLAREGKRFDEVLDEAYTKAGEGARRLAGKGREWENEQSRLREAGSAPSRWNPSQWNIKNLNFDSLLLAAVLGVILFIIFYYGR
jgi:formate hydrogenlyase subunit 3/multisubunit Na+/H+ antiporter MnhD subunit